VFLISAVLARRVISKNSGRQTFVQKLSHDKRIQPAILQSSTRFLLNSFSERSAMVPRYTIATKKAPEPHRQARRPPRAHAAQDACNEPGEAGCRTRPHLPAGAEIRERHQPHGGQPVAANVRYPSGAS